MKLECYALHANPPDIVPARPDRRWMDESPSRHAYRCLPLSIANTFGWDLLCPTAFSIEWNGGPEATDIQLHCESDFPHFGHFAMSHFTRGIVTFHTGYIFRTEPGWELLATSTFNDPKDGIAPLTGLIETDWLPYPFTMNWQLTRPGIVSFAKGEPFCHIIPVAKHMLDDVCPEIHALDSNSELESQYNVWREKREVFMAGFRAGDSDTLKQAWQKYYFKGELPDHDQPVDDHTQKLRLASPVDLRRKPGIPIFTSTIVSADAGLLSIDAADTVQNPSRPTRRAIPKKQ